MTGDWNKFRVSCDSLKGKTQAMAKQKIYMAVPSWNLDKAAEVEIICDGVRSKVLAKDIKALVKVWLGRTNDSQTVPDETLETNGNDIEEMVSSSDTDECMDVDIETCPDFPHIREKTTNHQLV